MNGINLINIKQNMELEWPKSLALDFDINRLYWCGLVHYKVYHSNLDLTDVKSIRLESNKRPWLLVIHKGMFTRNSVGFGRVTFKYFKGFKVLLVKQLTMCARVL